MLSRYYRDLISSLACIAMGIIFLIGSMKYGDIRSGIPSAGYLPFIGGVILTSLSLISLLITIIKKKEGEKIEKFFPEKDSWGKILILLFALFAYGIGLGYLGFLITTLLFMIFLLKFLEPQKWITILIASFLTSASTYILFEVLLKVQLPYGIFDFVEIKKWILKLW
jgi:hypothetical protein